jgi:hypothetical protein
MPACIHVHIASPILTIKAAKTDDFVKARPFPNKVQENI